MGCVLFDNGINNWVYTKVYRTYNKHWEWMVEMNFAKGIDLSHWEFVTDWKAVKESGIVFDILKATEATGWVDNCFKGYYDSGMAIGIASSPYHYFDFRYRGIDQAKHFINTIKGRLGFAQWNDIEEVREWKDGKWTVVPFPPRTTWLAGLKEFHNSATDLLGHQVGVYLRPSIIKYLAPIPDWMLELPLWIAHWQVNDPNHYPWSEWKFWQYVGDVGIVPGIKGGCDLNYFNGTVDDFRKFIGQPPLPPMTIEERVTRLEKLHDL